MSEQVTISAPGELELLVDFTYLPAEPPETGPEARYPGCREQIEIEHVTLNGHNITQLLSEQQLEAIEQEIWAWMKNADYTDLEPITMRDFDLP